MNYRYACNDYLLVYRQKLELQRMIKRLEGLQKRENPSEYFANIDAINMIKQAIQEIDNLSYQHALVVAQMQESEDK